MQKINALFPLSGLYLLALALALPACDEPTEDEASVAQDDDEEDAAERTGQLQLEDGTELTYAVKDGQAVLDGDILLGEADALETSFRAAGSTVTPWGGMWPGGVVYFQIQPGFSANYLVPAIQHWEALTGIQFVNYPHPNGYVQIGRFYDGCSAHLGRQTNAVTTLNIGPGCDTLVIIAHEIGHVVGLHHEHSRTDRDYHLNILWQNIDPAYHSAFQKYIKTGYANGQDFGPYDHASVMHYDSWAFFGRSGQLERSDAHPQGRLDVLARAVRRSLARRRPGRGNDVRDLVSPAAARTIPRRAPLVAITPRPQPGVRGGKTAPVPPRLAFVGSDGPAVANEAVGAGATSRPS
jgi:hypothetical protein